MKIFTKQIPPSGPVPSTQTAYEVPNSTIAWGAIIIALIQAAVSILTGYVNAVPKQKTDMLSHELKEKNFHVQLLQRVLEDENKDNRANSIRLILSAGLISDPDKKLAGMLEKDSLPRWSKRPLESLSGSLENTSSSRNTPPTGSSDTSVPKSLK